MSKKLDVRVKAVRKTKSGGIVVEIVIENELKRIKECARFGKIGLSVEMPRRIGSKVIMYDVPNEMTSEVLMREIYKKNVKGCVSEGEFKERVRIVSRGGKKDAACGNVVLEVPSKMKNVLCNEGRVFVCWKAFRVKEFVNVLRCHRCYAYGHMMREYVEKERLCQKCGLSGHMMKDCKKEYACRNCKVRGCKYDHSVLSDECPEYKWALQRERARVNDDE